MATPMGAPAQTPPERFSTEARWSLGIGGILSILFGLVLWAWPGMSLHVLILVFGIFAIAAGVFLILSGVRSEDSRGRWLRIGEGVLAILAGIISLGWPAITARALLFLIAAWAIATGIMEIVTAFRSGKAAGMEWLLILSGVVSIIFGILLLVWPGLGLLALIWLIGIYAVIHGVTLLVYAFSGRQPAGYTAGYGQGYGPAAPGQGYRPETTGPGYGPEPTGTPRAPA
jgi:uncharacterized membrane protein HdeD (DUF308 family)